MKTKEERIIILDREFRDISPNGKFLKDAIEALIEKYDGKWEKNLEIEIPGDKEWFFVRKFPESIQLTNQILMKIGIIGKVKYENKMLKVMNAKIK